MKIKLLNITKFAEFAGVSRGAVNKQIKAGKIIVRKDGKIDTTHPDNADYVTKHNNGKPKQPDPKKFKNPSPLRKSRVIKKVADAKKKTIKTKSKKKPPKSKQPKNPKEYESPHKEEENPESIVNPQTEADLDKVRYNEANRLKIIEDVKTKRFKRDIERETLIPRQFVRAILGKLVMIDVNEFLTLGNNIASEVAGMMGINDSKKIIKIGKFVDKKLYKIINHKKRLINKDLKKVNSEPIEEIKPKPKKSKSNKK